MIDDMTTEDLDYVADRAEAQALRAALPYIDGMIARAGQHTRTGIAPAPDRSCLRQARALILRRLEVL